MHNGKTMRTDTTTKKTEATKDYRVMMRIDTSYIRSHIADMVLPYEVVILGNGNAIARHHFIDDIEFGSVAALECAYAITLFTAAAVRLLCA